MMFKTTLIVAAAALTVSAGVASASAGSDRITDAQYVQAGRCQALMSARSLGGADSHAIDALLSRADRGRTSMAYDREQQAHDDAAEQASTASGYRKSELIAERDGACQAMLAAPAAFAKTN